jgi:hypothetical protein
MDALQRILALIARRRRLLASAGTLRILWILIALQCVLLAALGWFSLRYPLSPALLEAMAWTYALYLPIPLIYWIRFRARGNSPQAIARDLDRANPAAPDPFRTVLSLENHDQETRGQLDRLFAGLLPGLTLPRARYLPRPHAIALAAAAAALAAAAAATGRPGEFFYRSALPWSALERLPILRFDVEPQEGIVGVGDTAMVRAHVRNRLPGQAVYAYVRAEGGESRFPIAVGADGSLSFAYGPAETDFSIQFAGDNGRSGMLRYRVIPPPFLERIQAILQPPAYTRLRPDTLPRGVARFPVLAGTKVTWLLESDRDLRDLVLGFRNPENAAGVDSAIAGRGGPAGSASGPEAGKAAKELAPRDSQSRLTEDTLGPGKAYRVEREVRSPLEYSVRLEDANGIRSRPMPPYRVDILPDRPPEAEILTPGSDTVLDREAAMPLAFRVKDDYGVSSLKLVYKVMADGKARKEGRLDGQEWLKQARAGVIETSWDLRPLGLRPENTVEFHLVATDNDTVNGPKTGRSAVRVLRMPSVQEVLAATRKNEQSAVANLKSAIQREKQLERKMEREKQAPREEGPPMLADYEINRIMVDDPQEHQRRMEASLAQMQQSLEKASRQDPSGGDKSDKAGKEMAQVRSSAKEMQDFLKKAEPSLPRGNQGMLPEEERRKNLDNLMKAQKEESAKLAALREKLEKAPPGKPQVDLARMQLDNLAKELERNLQNQGDLRKMLEEQAAQAKAKSDMMDQAIQEQMRMAEDMKNANEDLKKSMDQSAKNGMLSPELMEKMKQVQQLLQEVLPDSLRQMMESKLRGQEVNEEELRQRLAEMLEKQAELAENLNRALSMLESLKDRRRMGELKQALNGLQKREEALAKTLESGQAGSPEDAEQKSIQQETQKALSDFSAQSAGRKPLQDLDKKLKPGPVQKDMQDVRQSVAAASKGKSQQEKKASSSSASKSASSAAQKLDEMGEMLGDAMAGMEGGVDLSEAQELLQESLALSRLQLLIRSGAAKRQSEGWESDETALYGSVAQTAKWLNDRVKILAAKMPFMTQVLTQESRGMAAASQEAARQYTWSVAEKSLRHNQNLSRELLKILKMAQEQEQGGGAGSGSSSSSGQSGGQQGGDISGQLKGMSGKQMAINQATYQLLQAMMEGRQGPGQRGGKQGQSGMQQGGQGQNGQNGQGSEGGEGNDGEGGNGGKGGEGSMGGMANKQGELGESLESLAESLGEEGGSAQKVRGLADEARRLEEDMRMGRLTPEELKRRQERFQSRLLEASNAMQERGQSESRQAETARGRPTEVSAEAKAAEEARLLRLLREARRNAKDLPLTEGQRKYLDEYYESLLTR